LAKKLERHLISRAITALQQPVHIPWQEIMQTNKPNPNNGPAKEYQKVDAPGQQTF
jgi:hypothetical protein